MIKLLSQKPILTADFFTVFEDHIQLPSGEERVYRSAKREPSVAVFPVDNEGNIYLIDQDRYLLQRRVLEGIGGMIENGLSPLETAKKELKEEAGIEAGEWKDLGSKKAASSILTWDNVFFVAQDLNLGDQELEDSEDIKVVKIPLTEAVAKVMSGEIISSTTIIGILMVDKLRQEGKL